MIFDAVVFFFKLLRFKSHFCLKISDASYIQDRIDDCETACRMHYAKGILGQYRKRLLRSKNMSAGDGLYLYDRQGRERNGKNMKRDSNDRKGDGKDMKLDSKDMKGHGKDLEKGRKETERDDKSMKKERENRKWSMQRGGRMLIAAVVAAMLLCPGCSGEEQMSDDSSPESAETTVQTEEAVQESAGEEIFLPVISWKDAGLEDHVMDWKDANLEAGMREITDITEGDIMLSDVWEITELDLSECGISDISALSELTNLQKLELWKNNIGNISEISGLTNLQVLNLTSNAISDIRALNGLTNLQELYLVNNAISDISALSGLMNLQKLGLGGNSIDDISVISGLTNLQVLNLSDTAISDINALSSLTNLQGLNLCNNAISDISALSGLTNLQELYLDDNAISDISALSGLTNLQELWLAGNAISDYSPVDFVPEVVDDIAAMYLNCIDLDEFTQELREIGYDEICLASSVTHSYMGGEGIELNYFSVKDGNHYVISEGMGEETLVLYVPYTPTEFSCDSKNVNMYYSQYYDVEYDADNNITNIKDIFGNFYHGGFYREESSFTVEGDRRQDYETQEAYIRLDFVGFKGDDVPVNFSVTFEDGSTQEMTVYITRHTIEAEGGEVDELTALYNDYKNESAIDFTLALCDAGYDEICLVNGDGQSTTYFSVKDGNHYTLSGEDYDQVLLYVPDIPTGFSCDNGNIGMYYWYKEDYEEKEYEKNSISLSCDFEGDDVPVNIYVTFEDGTTQKITVYLTRHVE